MKDAYLPPRILQAIGIALLIGMIVFWGATGRESVLFVGAATSMIGLGAAGSVKRSINRNTPPPDE